MTLYVGNSYTLASGHQCVLMAFGKDSETQAVQAIYRSQEGRYWTFPADTFEQEATVPAAPEPSFTWALGRYKHFKGHHYNIVVRARDARTLTNVLVYQHADTGETWVRPESMFGEEVTWPDGSKGPRFKPRLAELPPDPGDLRSPGSSPGASSRGEPG